MDKYDTDLIIELITLRIEGNITPGQDRQLEEWLADSATNREFYERITTEGYLDRRLVEYESCDLSDIRQEVLGAGTRTSRRPQLLRTLRRVAAIFVIPLLAVGVYFLARPSGNTLIADFQPGWEHAVLETAAGRRIELTADNSAITFDENGVRVTNDGTGLSYTAEDDARADLQYNKLIIPYGGEYMLRLSDGSRVWLNAGTELRYPVAFSGEEREVYLTGEAYFEVEHSAKPFIVHHGDMSVRVLGTSFNVMAYDDEPLFQTTLASGRVEVLTGDTSVTLSPGQQANIDKNGTGIEVREVAAVNYTRWKDDVFVFDDEPLEVMARKLGRWYGVEIVVESQGLRNSVFYGVVRKHENLSRILDMLKQTYHIKYEIMEDKVVISKD